MAEIKEIPIREIRVGEHEQRFDDEDDEISGIAGSIQRLGLLDPLCVADTGDGYLLIYGHRRLEACKRIGKESVKCFVAVGNEATRREITFAENFFRKDLTPIELAAAIANELKEGRMTVDQLAAGFRKTKDWVRKQIEVVSWPVDVLEGIHTGKLSIAAASNLACITEDFYRKSLVRQAVENGATARTTSAWLQAWRSMIPLAEAVEVEPEPGVEQMQPMVPQAPCIVCHDIFRTDQLSHIPVCARCIKVIIESRQGVMS